MTRSVLCGRGGRVGPLENEDGVGGAGSKFSDEQVVHQNFRWPPLVAHPTYARLNLFVFIAFLHSSHWAEKECSLSLLERT